MGWSESSRQDFDWRFGNFRTSVVGGGNIVASGRTIVRFQANSSVDDRNSTTMIETDS
jgi:hypothetical protein